MNYQLNLYISLQPENDIIFAHDLPKLSNNEPWWGIAASINEQEYQQFFPKGYQTSEDIDRLLEYLYAERKRTAL